MKKILIVELAGIGDLVMASPAIRAIRKCYPHEHIAVLNFSRSRDLIARCPYIDELHLLQEGSSLRKACVNLKLTWKLRRQRFDIAVNLYNLYSWPGALKMKALFWLLDARTSVGRNTNRKGSFYNIKVKDRIPLQKHQVECIMDVARALGCNQDDYRLEAWSWPEDTEHIEHILEQEEVLKDQMLIGINPGSFRPSRRWPPEYFARTADELARRYNAKIIITGSKSETDLAQSISQMMKTKPVITAGAISLPELVALIRRCDLYLSNDSGPMHIANALKRPLVAIAGPSPQQYMPYNKENSIVVRKDVSCSPCFRYRCSDLRCLKSISSEDILKAAEKLLS